MQRQRKFVCSFIDIDCSSFHCPVLVGSAFAYNKQQVSPRQNDRAVLTDREINSPPETMLWEVAVQPKAGIAKWTIL